MRLFIFIVILLNSIIGYAQTNVAHLYLGQAIVKNTNVHSLTSMTAYGQKLDYEVNADIKTVLKVTQVEPNRISLSITIDSMQSELSSNGIKMRFNSQDSITDSNQVFAQPLLDIVGKPYVVVIDSLGIIVSVDTAALERQSQEYMSDLVLTGSDLRVGSKFDLFQELPEDTVAIGRHWTDSLHNNQGLQVNQYKILSSLGNHLKLAVDGRVAKKIVANRAGIEGQTELTGDVTGSLECARSSGWISKRQLQINMRGSMNMNGTLFPTNSQTTISETIN